MKMNPFLLQQLRDAVAYVGGMPVNATERQRWDTLWKAVDAHAIEYSQFRELTDAHIDTALRRIAREDVR